MKTNLFDFSLPAACIAQAPVTPRDSARLLVVSEHELTDKVVKDLPALLKPGDVLVFNNTRVIPARLIGKRGPAKVEVTLLKRCESSFNDWDAFAKPARKLRVGDTITFAEGFSAEVIQKKQEGELTLRFAIEKERFAEALGRYGIMPLPPYIKRKHAEKSDIENYQTCFAKVEGAVAAPTAGLHFTKELFEDLSAKGIEYCFITLHVGAGTFLPVKVEDTKEHKMHSEYCYISAETAEKINAAKARGRRVVAVGTTSLRTLESVAGESGKIQAFSGQTDIFITPGYRFKVVDMLLTNFHLPRSTLFMLVCAFSGLERMKNAYAHAIQSGYRFYSYGDACLLECRSS